MYSHGFFDALSISFDIIARRINRYRKEKSNFEDQIVFLAGKKLYNTYFKNYTKKFWGVSPKSLSSKWVPSRIIPRFAGNSALEKQWLCYPKKGGFEEIANHYESEFLKHGGKITTNASPEILIENNKIAGLSHDGIPHPYDHVISTIPLPELLKKLGRETSIPYRSMIFVFIKTRKKRILDTCSICFFPTSELTFTRIYEMNSYSSSNSPKRQSGIGLEIPVFDTSAIWHSNDELIYKKIESQLVSNGFLKVNDVVGYEVKRYRYAYPIPTIEYFDTTDNIRKQVGIENLHLAGRNGLFEYYDVCQSLESGDSVISSIITSDKDSNKN